MAAECTSIAIYCRDPSPTNITPLSCHHDPQLATLGRLTLDVGVAQL
jgi:hypothetical protein